MTGFAEYLAWQQENHVNGIIISNTRDSSEICSYVTYKSEIDQNQPKVRLFFSDVSIIPSTNKINMRYIEKYNKRQFIESCWRALTLLHEGGHFVCKILDTLTRFTAGLIYLLYRAFNSIIILRPFTLDPSRPERFLVCRGLKYPVSQNIIRYLQNLLKSSNAENILEVVSLKCLLEPEFQKYLANTSKCLIQREIQALNKRLWYMDHENVKEVF